MAKRKLTLTVDEAVVARAHADSAAHRTSVSRLVTDYLDALGRAAPPGEQAYTPTVRRLLGVLPDPTGGGDYRDAYHRHLDAKYAAATVPASASPSGAARPRRRP